MTVKLYRDGRRHYDHGRSCFLHSRGKKWARQDGGCEHVEKENHTKFIAARDLQIASDTRQRPKPFCYPTCVVNVILHHGLKSNEKTDITHGQRHRTVTNPQQHASTGGIPKAVK